MAVNWTVLAIFAPPDESQHLLFLVRLAAFAVFIGAVVDKNRRG